MPSTRGAPGPSAAKPPPPASTASSSSLSSGRQDRNARANNAQKSATPHSQSSEEMSEPPRRSQRSHQPKKEETAVKEDNDVEDDAAAEGEDEEITRCFCGQQDYPGPPLSEAFNDVDAQAEDPGGLFISCDGCSVWQHGGCVGILEESQVPDKYYCEECKPKQHELHTDARGQKYSLYQPVYAKTNRKSSVSKHGDKAQKERDIEAQRASADPATGKRRATMRSKVHDVEEEEFRRAIEESKRAIEAGGIGRRNGKRGRDDSEENKQQSKRQRRTSEAAPLNSNAALVEDESEDELSTIDASKGKKARAEAAQSARQAEQREKDQEREKARAEAAGRRQERAGKRRADEDPAEETPKPSVSAKTSPPPSSQPESPQPDGLPEKVSHKKGAGKKTKKLGKNQYTKNRGVSNPSSPPNGKKAHLGNNQSTSSGDEPMANGDSQHKNNANGNGNGTNKNSPERGPLVKGKFGKGKHKGMNGNGGTKHGPEEPAELSLATMKRRMDAMAAFITKAQTELAGDRTPLNGGVPRVSVEEVGMAGGPVQAPTSGQVEEPANGKKFEEMNAMEMAGVVSKSITDWHRRFSQVA